MLYDARQAIPNSPEVRPDDRSADAQPAGPHGAPQHLLRGLSLPRDLQTIVLKTLEKEPNRRDASARALGEDLQRYLDGDPILTRLYQAELEGRLLALAGKKAEAEKPLAGALALNPNLGYLAKRLSGPALPR